jgi:hypothetical protein
VITTRFAASLPHVLRTGLLDPAHVRWARLADVLTDLALHAPDPEVRGEACVHQKLPVTTMWQLLA